MGEFVLVPFQNLLHIQIFSWDSPVTFLFYFFICPFLSNIRLSCSNTFSLFTTKHSFLKSQNVSSRSSSIASSLPPPACDATQAGNTNLNYHPQNRPYVMSTQISPTHEISQNSTTDWEFGTQTILHDHQRLSKHKSLALPIIQNCRTLLKKTT